LALSLGLLGVVAGGYSPVVLYANPEGNSPDAQTVATGSVQVSPGTADSPSKSKDETVAVWSPPSQSSAAPLAKAALKDSASRALPEAVYADALPALYEGDYDNPIWAVVTRGARLHSDPDVSSPTTLFYAVGAKLNVIGYRQGWYQVVDPETSRRGFIYANYYLEALQAPSDTRVLAKAPVPPPTHTALAETAPAQAPKLAVTRVSQFSPSRLAPAETPVPSTRPSFSSPRPSFTASPPDGVASLLEKALRP
jgi:hypothetical protein